MSVADEMIANLLNAGGLTGQAFAQGRQNFQNEQLGAQQLQFGQARLAEAQQKQQQDALFQQDLQAYSAAPDAQGVARLMAKYPQHAEELKKAHDALDEPARISRTANNYALFTAAKNGRADLASSKIDGLIEAERAQGLDTSEAMGLRDQLKSPDEAVRSQALKDLQAHTQLMLSVTDPERAKQLGILSDNSNHFGTTAGGGIFDMRTGQMTREPDPKPQYEKVKNADGTESIIEVNSGGGGRASTGTGASGSGAPVAGRTQYGWTPRARNGGDNSDAAVDGKLAGMAKFLGVDVDASIAGMSPMQIAKALTLSEGGPGSIADKRNNPGNLTDPKTGDYRYFPTKEAGLAAAAAQVARNLKRGQTTIRTMVEGLPVNGRVAAGGVGPRVVFTSKPGINNPVDQATVDFYAQKIAAGGDLPAFGQGKEAAAWRQAILKRAAQIQQGNGLTGGDSNLAQADVKANRSALLQAQKQYTATVGFEDTFQRNVNEVLRLAPSGVGGSAPIFNRWIQAGRKNISGDPAVSRFNVAVNTAANEYAKLASGASGGAVTSDSARHEAMQILNNAQTLPQLQAAIKQMQIDGHNRVLAMDGQIKRLRGNISGAGKGTNAAPTKGWGKAVRVK